MVTSKYEEKNNEMHWRSQKKKPQRYIGAYVYKNEL